MCLIHSILLLQAALIAQQQAAVLAVQRQALAAQLQLQQQQQQQQSQQQQSPQQPWLITQSAPQITTTPQQQVTAQAIRSVTPPPATAAVVKMIPSPQQPLQQQQQPQLVAISVTNPILTASPAAADRASPGPPSRGASPAPHVQQQPTANNNNIIQQPNNNILLQQPQPQQHVPQAPTTMNVSPVPQIIPKLEPGTTCLGPPQFKISSVPNSQQHQQRNSISPAPNPQLQVAQQPHRPNSAPVPGHLMENPPEYVPFTLNREVPSFLVSFTPTPPPETPATSASDVSTTVVPSTTPTPTRAITPSSQTVSPVTTPQKSTPSFIPPQQHTFEAKQRYSPSQLQRSSPAPYYNPRTASPARGVSPLVHSSSRGSSPAPGTRSGANSPIHPRSRDPSPGPPSRSREVSPAPSPVPKVALIVPDLDKSSSKGTTHTSSMSRPKPNPLNLPTSVTNLPIPSPNMLNYPGQALKSGGLATPCLPTMTPNTITGFNSLPTPMMLTSPLPLGGAQRTPIMPLHFWSSLSPVATLSPRPGHTGSAPSTFQFPSYMNGHLPFSPVVTIPAFSAFDLQSPVVTAAPSSSGSIQVPWQSQSDSCDKDSDGCPPKKSWPWPTQVTSSNI